MVSTPAATGQIAFYNGVSFVGSANIVDGSASLATKLFTSGKQSFTAFYGGDSNYGSSLSSPVALTVQATSSSGFVLIGNSPFTTNPAPRDVAIADLNGDGKADVVVANTNEVVALLGDGSGGLRVSARGTVPPDDPAVAVAVADFDGDGKLDAVFAGPRNHIYFFRGDGSGGLTFANVSTVPFAFFGATLAAADMNSDGKADLVVSGTLAENVSVLLGNGSGGFSVAPGSPVGFRDYPGFVLIGDFNGDGNADVGARFPASIQVGFGDGRGGLSAPISITFPTISFSGPVVADLNGDGISDMALSNEGTLVILLGNKSGTFSAVPQETVPPVALDLWASVDVNGDGIPDLMGFTRGTNQLSVILGKGDGQFVASGDTPTNLPSGLAILAIGEFNGDGKPDLLAISSGSGSFSVLLGGALPTQTSLSVGSTRVQAGDEVHMFAEVTPAKVQGLVTFYDGNTVIAQTVLSQEGALFSTHLLSAGLHSIRAMYSGDPADAVSWSDTVEVTVLPGSTAN